MNKTSCLLALLWLLASPAWAQDDDNPNGDSETSTASEVRTSDIHTSAADNESFTPTEEISEDLSVSFPIDI